MLTTNSANKNQDIERDEVLNDYYIGRLSRELSNFIRRDVMTGRAKFGVSDDGKEVYQLAQAKAIKNGDWRADYYRGHTLLLATGQVTVEQLLAQLYSDAANDPFSKGRQMNNHHATPTVDTEGNFLNHLEQFNVSSATSPTAGQMARGLGLAFASKIYRTGQQLEGGRFSRQGQEISWVSIGDASTSEGVFWEVLNAAGVVQVPMAVTVVDDGYGISVPVEYQTTKGSISAALDGLKAEKNSNGIDIYTVKGWDYDALTRLYPTVAEKMRKDHRAALIHVQELTQPNGHSTSGSHERYKGPERMKFEEEYDCLRQFRLWMLGTGIAEAGELEEIEARAKKDVREARARAWKNYVTPLREQKQAVVSLLENSKVASTKTGSKVLAELRKMDQPVKSEITDLLRRMLFKLPAGSAPEIERFVQRAKEEMSELMGKHLYSETPKSPVRISAVPALYAENEAQKNGYEVLQEYFKAKFAAMDTLYAFGEDVGKIGDVNQGFAGVQAEFGEHRIFDTGIREWSIAGQAMGMSMRGLHPIVEVQYLDYIYYALPLLTDDVATMRWRTAGMQACPMIIRSRGHRLEGIWHSGSYLSPLIGSLRGMHLCVPRNMVQAAGMYNTLLEGDDPGIVIEVLNAYRLKEKQPTNLTEFRVPLGVPEIVREGSDLTVVTYGACVRICVEAAELLEEKGIDIEVIDIQTLLPFDLEHRIADRLKTTNRLMIVDEDTPGGASAFILQQITEQQGGFLQLDAPITTVTSKAHRPAYGDDGNYTSKPQVMDVVDAALEAVMF